MKPFDFFKPESADAAVEALAAHSPNVRILAGGTDAVVDLKHVPDSPGLVVDVSQLKELKGIEVTDAGLRIGAGVTHTEIMKHPLIEEHAPALIDAAHTIGAVQTRNLGTLGGNLVTCVPSMDSGPTLMALEAEVTVTGPTGKRTIPLGDFFVGPRKTILEKDALLLEIIVPAANLGKPASFIKFGLRKGQALALVNAASALWIEDGKFKDVRISLGAVAPVVIRAPKAEAILEGQSVTELLVDEAAKTAVSEAKPIDDFRASKEYRNDLIEVGVRRTLKGAIDAASI
ncbi:MAG: FAD binding domain-containing protein [Rhodospirillales bacterium]|nr:carbon monoxide dehydrogenase [Rhodospirillaceae bacterium]MDP6108877.1 FAD binding domain-containing protein [Rhodospirillales bacterium]